MPTIRRLTHSCLLVAADEGNVLLDPDVFTWTRGVVDLDSVGDDDQANVATPSNTESHRPVCRTPTLN